MFSLTQWMKDVDGGSLVLSSLFLTSVDVLCVLDRPVLCLNMKQWEHNVQWCQLPPAGCVVDSLLHSVLTECLSFTGAGRGLQRCPSVNRWWTNSSDRWRYFTLFVHWDSTVAYRWSSLRPRPMNIQTGLGEGNWSGWVRSRRGFSAPWTHWERNLCCLFSVVNMELGDPIPPACERVSNLRF